MRNTHIFVDGLRTAFREFSRPRKFYRFNDRSSQQRALEKSYRRVRRGSFGDEQAGVALVDASILSDAAVLYLLPDLAAAGLRGINSFMLVDRLQSLDTEHLSDEQRRLIEELTKLLEDAEEEIDRATEAELQDIHRTERPT